LETTNLILIPHVPAYLVALTQGQDSYEKISGRHIANGLRDFMLAATPDFMARLRAATQPDPWNFGFAVIHKIDNGAGGTRSDIDGQAREGWRAGKRVKSIA
jgi:hypothetical protein